LDALENIFHSSRKISDDFFKAFNKIFPVRLLKFLTTFSTFFHQLPHFTKIRSLDATPLVLHHALVTTFVFSLLSFTYIF